MVVVIGRGGGGYCCWYLILMDPSNVTIGSCEATCFGQDCDGWDDYGGTDNSTCDLYGDDLTIEYGCDCKGCACQQAYSA